MNATGPLPNLGEIPGDADATETVGGVTFSLAPPSEELFIGTGSLDDWTARLPGPDIAISGVENLNVGLAVPVTALGFDFVDPEFDSNFATGPLDGRRIPDFVDSTFTVTLLMGATVVHSFTFNTPNDTAAFVGVWSDTPFDQVEIRETVGGVGNQFFGQFYTTPVPEPSTLLLLASGIAGVGGVAWRRRRRT